MIQTSNALQEAMRAMSRIGQVEMMSKRVARGLPPVEPQAPPPQPPTPEEKLGNVLHPHQVEAVAQAIAAAPPDQQGQLISEAHDSLTRWINAHQGKVIIDGRIHLAKGPEQASSLAAQIVNREIEGRDRKALAQPSGAESSVGSSAPPLSNNETPQSPPSSPVSSPVSSSAQDSARPPLQPTADVGQLRAAAAQNAPALTEHLENAVAGVPGAEVTGVRDEKDPARLAEKIGAGQSPETVSDYLAGRIAVETPDDKEQVVANLKGQAPVIQDDDHFHDGGKNQFHSQNLQMQVHPDISAEVQVVPREQADIADQHHGTYEQQRSAAAQGDEETADRLGQDLAGKNDQAMQEFNARQDHGERARQSLQGAGFQVGEPIKLGGRVFLAIHPGTTNEVPNVQWDQDDAAAVPGSSPETEAAAGAEDSALAPAAGSDADQPARRYAKGEAVSLADGSQGTVAYHHPSLDVVRVKVGGRNRTVSSRDLSAAS